jgi:hypothetical protein
MHFFNIINIKVTFKNTKKFITIRKGILQALRRQVNNNNYKYNNLTE